MKFTQEDAIKNVLSMKGDGARIQILLLLFLESEVE